VPNIPVAVREVQQVEEEKGMVHEPGERSRMARERLQYEAAWKNNTHEDKR
jgi:hypothetical protein